MQIGTDLAIEASTIYLYNSDSSQGTGEANITYLQARIKDGLR